MGIVLNMHLSIYLVDLSRHTTVNHELYIAKLAAYGFSGSSLRLIQNYLSKRRQWVKIGSSLNGWQEIILGVPQRSKSRPILFNIFISDFVLKTKQMFVTSLMMSTLYNCGSYLDLVSHKFEMGANIAIKWLKNN